ncbi:hypothetical protein MRB53_002242 [Persea americana]|uniref:Uncharacterized protein n=1 Tax=Persea americana TaxID=3435 RepID=A0ACC2MU59_PERAE|nr:hypothetical protein MRB53_002242 [Persea americana]
MSSLSRPYICLPRISHQSLGRSLLIWLEFPTRGMGDCSSGNPQFFPLTALQIGDLQSYLSHLCLYLAPESNTFFILVDNRPWLINQDSRTAQLWQLMVTKSRLSPFANTKLKRERKDFRKMVDLKSSSRPNPRGRKILYRWFSVIDAELYQKKALLPVKKLKDSLLSNSEVRRTLYGFIVFEVAWTSVRGINYLNELQTDTSMALEAKLMKRWEFDSVEQASRCISSWFSGTPYERFLLQKYLDDISSRGEVFYDAQDDPLVDLTNDGENKFNSDYLGDGSPFGSLANFKLTGGSEYGTSSLHTPPPPSGPYKRRKVMKCASVGRAHFSSVIWVVAGSTSSVVVNLVGIILLPLWAIISVVWRIVMAVIYPLFCIAWEVLVAPIRLVLASASLIVWLFSSIFYLLKESWLSLSGIFQLASASESAVGAYDVPIWRSLWNDLFSQIFCAIRSIVYGFVAFFATCNRHRLSINNHMQEFLLRLSFLVHNSPVDSFLARMKHGGYDQSSRRRYPSNSSARPQYQQNREKTHKRGKES